MSNTAKHAFGSSSNVEQALQNGKIDSRDILFMDENTNNPKVGWITRDGKVVVATPDISGIETELALKVNAEEVDEKINIAVVDSVASSKAYTDGKVEAAINEHMAKKYEITSVPIGTLVDYRESEIRIMCPNNSEWTKQSVGTGGDANCYYATFKTFVPNDGVVGYIERLNDKVDEEILTNFSIDEYGRRYQTTWLALAKYDESTDVWTYLGENSSANKYIGWDYQIDWYNADGKMASSDCIRINLSNEKCHSSIEPYYVGAMMTEVDAKIEEKITEVNSAYEIVEF